METAFLSACLGFCLLAGVQRPPVRDTGRYSMAGRTRLVPAEANLKPNRYGNGRDWLTVRVGERHPAVGEGTFILDYVKPSRAPESAYQLQLLTYTYSLNDSVSYNIDCAHHLTGTLHKLRNGGYSGTFAGASQAKEGEEYPVQGDFSNVHIN